MNKQKKTENIQIEKLQFPMRINRYLATKGHSTRRGADLLITKNKVFINGKLAELGDKVTESDKVEVRSKNSKKYSYYAYNKPRGIVTHSPQKDEEDIKKMLGGATEMKDVFPIGRLDKESHGLIILTNDGRITDRLLNPEFTHEKEYIVKTKNRLRESFKKYMEQGVKIEDYTTKPCKVRVINDHLFSIIITEGKKHQIRRMVVAMHNEVKDLQRTRILNITLGKLEAGEFREIKSEELKEFLTRVGL